MEINKNEIKKELYKSKVNANFSRYCAGKLFYTVQMEQGLYQFPIATVEKHKWNAEVDKSIEDKLCLLSEDLGITNFEAEIKASMLNRWIDKANDEPEGLNGEGGEEENEGCINYDALYDEVEAVLDKHGIDTALLFISCPDCGSTNTIAYNYGTSKENESFVAAANCIGQHLFLEPELLWWVVGELDDAVERLNQETVLEKAEKLLSDAGRKNLKPRKGYRNRHKDGLPQSKEIYVIHNDADGENIHLCSWVSNDGIGDKDFLGTASVLEGTYMGRTFRAWGSNDGDFIYYKEKQ